MEFIKSEIIAAIQNHPLTKFNGKILKVYLIGSYSSGKETERSDIDILLMVKKRKISEEELTQKHRVKLINHFMKNNIKSVSDDQHPTYNGKRIDIYFTYSERTRLPFKEIQ